MVITEIRLDKYLADMQAGTRSEVKELIRRKSVTVNGRTALRPDMKINTGSDEVSLNGRIIEYEEFEYFMLNKPSGVLSAANDPKAVTVVDLIIGNKRKDLFPVGRLDKDSEGLMLITNDGDLSHRLLSPGSHTEKSYYVKLEGRLTRDVVDKFEKGLDINICKCEDDETDRFPEEIYHTLPAQLKIISSQDVSEAVVTLHEGKFHQVKRMFMAAGCRVTYLRRVSVGPLRLDYDLKPGEYRKLTPGEIEALKGRSDGGCASDLQSTGVNIRAVSDPEVIPAASECRDPDGAKDLLDDMLNNIKAVIFDMDGTLLDSMDLWKQIDIDFLDERGLEHPHGMSKEIEGMSFHETAVYFKERFMLSEELEEIEQIWHKAAHDKYVNEICLKPDARELLAELKKRKLKIGIATSNSRELVGACLESLGIISLFDTIVTGSDVNHGKPDPEIYLTAAENMSVFPQNCLVFEDVVMGLAAGISAGMRTCAVYDDFSKEYDEEKKKMSDYYITSFKELV